MDDYSLVVFGLSGTAIGCLLLGPSPLLPLLGLSPSRNLQLYLTIAGNTLVGACCAFSVVPVTAVLKRAVDNAAPGAKTDGVVSALVTQAFALGTCLGSVVGATLVEALDSFPWTATIMACALVLLLVLVVVHRVLCGPRVWVSRHDLPAHLQTLVAGRGADRPSTSLLRSPISARSPRRASFVRTKS